MDVFNLQAKIGLDVEEYMNGIKNAVNNSKKLVDAVNKMAEQAVTAQTQTDKAGKSMQGAAENADSLGKSVNGAVSPIDKMSDAIEDAGDEAKNAAKGLDKMTDATGTVEDSADDAADATDNLGDSIKDEGKNADKTKDKNKKLGDETEKAGNKAKESGNKFEQFGGKLKSAAEKVGHLVAAVAKVSAAVVGAASAGLTAITKQSIDAYSTYEQLVGGIEAAFEGNQKAIDTVLATGKDAWKTLTMSSNDYFNAFMSAYPLVKSGMADQNAAVETTNKLMQLEADLANTFGYTSENAANAINWALKGTYSYLDNLNIGIKGTKEGFLEAANASGLFNETFASVDDMTTDQQIDVIMHYAAAYGVLDRTANEAAGTLEGSSKALKAAWENLLAGFGREDADLKQLSDDLMTSVSAVASNFAPRIGQVLEGIGATLPVLIPQAYEEAKKLIADNAGSFVSGVSAILTSGAGVIGSILDDVVSVLPEKLPEWLDKVSGLIVSGLSNATDKLSKIGEIGGNLISLVFDGLESNLPDIISGLNDFFGRLIQQIPKLIDGGSIGNIAKILIDGLVGGIDALIDNADGVFKLGADLIVGLGNGLAEALPSLIARIPEIIQAIADGITNNIDDIILTAETIISSLVDAIMDPETLAKVVSAAISLAGAILQGLGDGLVAVANINDEIFGVDFFKEHALDIGKAIIQGIHDGFYSIDALQGIIDFIGGTLGEAYLTAETVINDTIALLAPYEQSFEDLGADIYDFIEEFKKNWRDGWDTLEEIGGKVYDGIENFKSGWTEFWANIAATMSEKIVEFKQKIQEIPDKFNELIDNAKTWGNDLLQNFIDGIGEKISALARGVSDAANTVKKYLGFSEPEAGPLSDFHTYAPDMMELFAKGIRDNEHLITDQFDKSLGQLEAPEMTAKMTAETAYRTSGYNQTGNTIGGTEAILALLQAILQAVREGRIVAIDDAGYRTINEGLARIQRFDEGGAFV